MVGSLGSEEFGLPDPNLSLYLKADKLIEIPPVSTSVDFLMVSLQNQCHKNIHTKLNIFKLKSIAVRSSRHIITHHFLSHTHIHTFFLNEMV